MARIAVIGAAGYVGQELIRQIKTTKHEVIGITRSNGKFLLQPYGIKVEHPSNAKSLGEFDVVINLAFPNSGSNRSYSKQNRELFSLIKQLAGKKGKIIHISTIAVFGFGLDLSIKPMIVKQRRDYQYVEIKIELENLLIKYFPERDLHIVRLGNVWGPASPTWTVSLIERIIWGRFVGTNGIDGLSNMTDVANAAAYILYLAELEPRKETSIHHVAEMGHLPWKYWIEKISNVLSIEPIYYAGLINNPRSTLKEFLSVFSELSPNKIYKKLVWGRFTGSFTNSLMRLIPDKYFEALKKINKRSGSLLVDEISAEDSMFLTIVGATKLFQNQLEPNWIPPISKEKSWENVQTWMTEAGYLD